MYTINAAHASGRRSEEGSIEVGKRANLLILDRDPVLCHTSELRKLQMERTYVAEYSATSKAACNRAQAAVSGPPNVASEVQRTPIK